MYMCVAPAGGNKRPADAPSGDAPPPKRLVDSAFPLDFVNLTGRWRTVHSAGQLLILVCQLTAVVRYTYMYITCIHTCQTIGCYEVHVNDDA